MLAGESDLRELVTFCVHCGIRFLVDPRNAGRIDLRCPFGCRKHHRAQRSKERSAAYYRTASGKTKKQRLNARRSERARAPDSASDPAEPVPEESSQPIKMQLAGVTLDDSCLVRSPILSYVQLLVQLAEGFRLSSNELITALRESMRQHSIAYRSRVDYVLQFLHQHPP